MVAPTPSGYSATVKLELEVGEERIPLAQIGGGELVFYQEVVLPGNVGIVVAYIDESVHRWEVEWERSEAGRTVVAAKYRVLEAGVVTGKAGYGAEGG
jgi:hypothetical protein